MNASFLHCERKRHTSNIASVGRVVFGILHTG